MVEGGRHILAPTSRGSTRIETQNPPSQRQGIQTKKGYPTLKKRTRETFLGRVGGVAMEIWGGHELCKRAVKSPPSHMKSHQPPMRGREPPKGVCKCFPVRGRGAETAQKVGKKEHKKGGGGFYPGKGIYTRVVKRWGGGDQPGSKKDFFLPSKTPVAPGGDGNRAGENTAFV